MDELGSGLLNVNKYIGAYAGNVKPQFIEGHIFRMVIPVTEVGVKGESKGIGVIDTVRDTVNDTVKNRLVNLIMHLLEHPGLKSNQLAKILGISEVSVRRDIQKINTLVQFKGAPKTGGYVLSQELHDKLQARGLS